MEHTPPSSVDLTLDLAAFRYREPLVFRTLRHYYQHHLYHIYIYREILQLHFSDTMDHLPCTSKRNTQVHWP